MECEGKPHRLPAVKVLIVPPAVILLFCFYGMDLTTIIRAKFYVYPMRAEILAPLVL